MGRCQCVLSTGPDKGMQCRFKAKLNSQFCFVHRNCDIRPSLSVLPIEMIDSIMRQSEIDDVLRLCQTNKEIYEYCLSDQSSSLFKFLHDRDSLPESIDSYATLLHWRRNRVVIDNASFRRIMPVLIEMLYYYYGIKHNLPTDSISSIVPDEILQIYEESEVDDIYDTEFGHSLYDDAIRFIPDPRRPEFLLTMKVVNTLPSDLSFIDGEARAFNNLMMTADIVLSPEDANILQRIVRFLNAGLTAYIDFESDFVLKYARQRALNDDPRGTSLADWILGFTQYEYMIGRHSSTKDLANKLYELKSHKFENHYELFVGVTFGLGDNRVSVKFDHGS